jgi:very-short-patch-repair endonuclease
MRGKTLEEFLDKARSVHGDKYDYSEIYYTRVTNPVTIRCAEHGLFTQRADSHLRGQGCKPCGFRSISISKKGVSHSQFIKKPPKIPYSKTAPRINRRHTTEWFIAKAKKFHGDKYDYSETVYVKNSQTCKIICPQHGAFDQLPIVHVRGGCLHCGILKRAKAKTKDTELFLKKSQEVHGDKFDYSQSVYTGTNDLITIGCKIHGLFTQLAGAHMAGRGCKQCGNNTKTTLGAFITLATEVHGVKFKYDSVQYQSAHKVVEIECLKHGIFKQTPHNHLAGKGCAKCQHFISKPEIAFLDLIGIPEEDRQFKIGKYKCDGYDRKTNTVYELDGDYYHGNPARYDLEKINRVTKKTFGEHYRLTLKKRDFILAAGFNMVSVWESELKEFTKEWLKHHPI